MCNKKYVVKIPVGGGNVVGLSPPPEKKSNCCQYQKDSGHKIHGFVRNLKCFAQQNSEQARPRIY